MKNVTFYDIEGLFSFENNVFGDDRGYFFESYNKRLFDEYAGQNVEFVQDNISKSSKGVLRGLHFQAPPFAQAKLVSVIKGRALDVAVDIRKDSPTYGQHIAIELTEDNFLNFFVPRGFAHGFVALEDNTVFSYKCDNFYNSESEDGILWNDESLSIQWGVNAPIISAKDQVAKKFSLFTSPF